MVDETLIYEIIASALAVQAAVFLGGARLNRLRKDGSLKLKNMPKAEDLTCTPDPLKRSILVRAIYDARRIGYPYDSVDLMEYILKRKGYHSKIIDSYMGRIGVGNAVRKLAESSNSNTQSVFYFSAHGSNEDPDTVSGIKIAGSIISPHQLFSMMSDVEGRKAIILDSCHSGIFSDYFSEHRHTLDDFVVIAACPSDHLTKERHHGWDGFIGDLTYGFYLMVEQSNWQRVNLADVDLSSGTRLERMLYDLKLKYGAGKHIIGAEFSFDVQRVANTDFLF